MDPSEMQARKDQARSLLLPWAKQQKLLHEIVDAKNFPEKPFRFADLPFEIRVMIYKLALLGNKPIELWPRLEPGSNNVRAFRESIDDYKRRVTPSLKLLRVSNWVNAEAAEVFYGGNEFRFSNIRGFIVLQCFLDTIGPANAARLRHIAVHVPFHGDYRDAEGNSSTNADNLPDSISTWTLYATSCVQRTYAFQEFAKNPTCVNFHTALREDYDSGGADGESTDSLPVTKNLLGRRPNFDKVAYAFRDVKVCLVFLGWTPDPSSPHVELQRKNYIEVHKLLMQRAEDADWDICEAITRFDGGYRIIPFNSFRFKTLGDGGED